MSIDRKYHNIKFVRNQVESGKWADKHGLFHELLPYGYRSVSPIETLQAYRDTFKKLGEYKQLYQASHLRKHAGLDVRRGKALEQLYWAGSWPVHTHRTGNPYSYTNPTYGHAVYPPVESDEQRVKIIKQTAEIPHWGPTKLGMAFDVTSRHAQRLRNDVLDSFDRTENRRKFTRTIKTIYSWGYNWKEIAYAFGYTTDTLRKRFRKQHAQEYIPPENPLNV